MALSGSSSLEGYRIKKFIILFFFLSYSVVQCAGQFGTTRGEYFPVFSWSLFSGVQNPTWALEVEVTRIGEIELAEPTNFFHLGEHFPDAKQRTSGLLKSVGRFYRLSHLEPEAARDMKRSIEQTYFPGHQRVEYQIVAVTFDPIKRWRTGEIQERTIVGRFSTETD